MLRFAQEAGDVHSVEYWTAAAERRQRHLIDKKLAALDRLEGGFHGASYFAGILARSGILQPGQDMDDIPAEHLRTVVQILDTHIRRIRHRHQEHNYV